MGIAPMYIGFADQCLSYLATRPLNYFYPIIFLIFFNLFRSFYRANITGTFLAILWRGMSLKILTVLTASNKKRRSRFENRHPKMDIQSQSNFFAASSNSSTLAASAVSFSFLKNTFGMGRILNRLFNFC